MKVTSCDSIRIDFCVLHDYTRFIAPSCLQQCFIAVSVFDNSGIGYIHRCITLLCVYIGMIWARRGILGKPIISITFYCHASNRRNTGLLEPLCFTSKCVKYSLSRFVELRNFYNTICEQPGSSWVRHNRRPTLSWLVKILAFYRSWVWRRKKSSPKTGYHVNLWSMKDWNFCWCNY